MTESASTMTAIERMRQTPLGLWTGSLEAIPAPAAQDVAAEIDALGYGSLWFGEAYGREALTHALTLATATTELVVATGIANIYGRGAMSAGGAARTIHALAPGRFVLGLGVSHQPLVERDRHLTYLPPLSAMTAYLDELDAAPYFAADREMPPVMIAALGPKMLELAAQRTAGAHPYLVTPAHTAEARATLGPGPALVVEQAAVIDQDREESLRRAHEHLNIYTGLPNYRNSWLRQGFDETDFGRGGSERLADALVVQGGVDDVIGRVREHLDAGADHVVVQVLGRDLGDVPRTEWRKLAGASDLVRTA